MPGQLQTVRKQTQKNSCPMKHRVLLLLLIAAASIPAVQPAKPADKSEMSRAEGNVDTMGSTFSVVAYGEDRDRLQAAVESALEEARRLDQLLSNYRPESEWSQV